MIQKKKDKKKKETTKKVFVYDKPTAPGEKKGNQIKTCKQLLNHYYIMQTMYMYMQS